VDQRTIEVFQQTGTSFRRTGGGHPSAPGLGTAREFHFGPKFGLIAEVDLENTFDGARNTVISTDAWSADPRVGIELATRAWSSCAWA
jgi:hypothetical protein